MAQIAIEDVSLTFPGGNRALDHVSLEFNAGESVALLGPNGAGKSTLLRLINGMRQPDSGRVLVGGADVVSAGSRELRELRRRIGFVSQSFDLIDNLSAWSNVIHGSLGRCWFAWTQSVAPNAERERALECLEEVGLVHLAGRRVDRMSGGQRQRVAVARTMMQEPDIVLADEPVASLDPRAGLDVMTLLQQMVKARNITLVTTLHQPRLALGFADRVVGLRSGSVVLDAPTADMEADELGHLYEVASQPGDESPTDRYPLPEGIGQRNDAQTAR